MVLETPTIGVVILAAGKGTRLQYPDLPKVMAPIGGQPILSYIVSTFEAMGFDPSQIVVVVGYRQEKIRDFFGNRVTYAEQKELLGTAHAAYTGIRVLPLGVTDVVVLGGDDSAFYTQETLRKMLQQHRESGAVLTLLTARVEHPEQLGRIVRHPNGTIEIIEKEYLTPEQKLISEISTGTFIFNRAWFESIFPTMPKLRKLGEYGLPTALAMAREAGVPYQVVPLPNPDEWFGVNTAEELAEADRRKKAILSSL